MSIDYVIRGTPESNQLPVPVEGAIAYDFVGGILYGTLPLTGEWVPLGGGPNGGPVIQAALQAINTTVPQTVTITAAGTVMYAVSLSMEASGAGASGHTVIATLSWTSPLTVHTVSIDLPLDTVNVVLETYPILCAAGTSITLSTAYAGGATNDPYTISARLVEMP